MSDAVVVLQGLALDSPRDLAQGLLVLPGEVRRELERRARQLLDRACELARSATGERLISAGDLFDHLTVSQATLTLLQERLGGLAQVRLVPGELDPGGAGTPYDPDRAGLLGLPGWGSAQLLPTLGEASSWCGQDLARLLREAPGPAPRVMVAPRLGLVAAARIEWHHEDLFPVIHLHGEEELGSLQVSGAGAPPLVLVEGGAPGTGPVDIPAHLVGGVLAVVGVPAEPPRPSKLPALGDGPSARVLRSCWEALAGQEDARALLADLLEDLRTRSPA